MLHTQPGCSWATGTASLGIWHETLWQSEDPAPEELVGQTPRRHPWVERAFLGPPQSPGAAAAGTFMPREEGSESPGLAPGLR